MRDFKIKLNEIVYQKKTYDEFLKWASSIITELHDKFNHSQINLPTLDIIDNSFQFTFWGLNFITKTEIVYDLERLGLCSGELNTYYRNDDKDDFILTYHFDYNGNIENRFLTEEFAFYYFVDMFDGIIEYSKNRKLKFQLK